MRLYAILSVLFFTLMAFSISGSKEYPVDYFRSPVNSVIRLSGTFGELRPNHLHAGIDIKAYNGKTGQPILAAAEGYVSRVKIQSGGYGNVLYLAHPNGYTTVYAHLGKLPEAVAKYVKDEQYRRQEFEVDLYPSQGRFAFAKGEKIGTLGMSGRSFGPHLHFEIRDSGTEKPINPLLFGIEVTDAVAPRLHDLKIYHLNDKLETLRTQIFKTQRGGKGYRVSGDTLQIGAWRVGIGLKAFDHFKGANNWNGVYAMELFKDDELVYDFKMETFAFNESRYINAHMDYEEQVDKNSYINRFFSLPGNRLSIYQSKKEEGVITLSKNKASKITMVAHDVEGNKSTLEFWLRRAEVKPNKEIPYNYLLSYDQENLISNANLRLYFPKGTLYENLYLRYHASNEESSGVYSSVHHLHHAKIPLHRYIDLAIAPTGLPEDLRSKAFIAFCKDNKMENCGGSWENGKLKTKIRSLGDYCIMVDQKAPMIKPIAYQNNMKGFSKMSFEIDDNFETARNVDEFTYEATVDGQWILMSFDSKKNLLTHYFDGRIGAGEHSLRLVVRDHVGNERVFERQFSR